MNDWGPPPPPEPGDEPQEGMHEVYGFTEREMAFKLMAAHALADPQFYEWLKKDPVAAATQLRIRLTERDVDYLRNGVQWDRLDDVAETVRESLQLEHVTNSW